MMKKLVIILVATFFVATNSFANELEVYPVEGVFSSKNISSQNFKQMVKTNGKVLRKSYLDTFYKYFPNAKKEISDKNKYKTFAAYIHVPRASEYVLKKSDMLVDIYLPLTMSINFVNMATGETLYSNLDTNYFKYGDTTTADKKKQQAKLQQLDLQNYKETMEGVVKKASEDFKPFDITTSVIDKYRSLYILDKGSSSGIAKGDLLTDENVNQLSVIYSDLNYSVANKVLGDPQTGSNFSKFANSSVTELTKPKILFINDFNDERIYNIFASALGSKANFSLLTTDKTFYDMQSALVSLNMDFKHSNLYKRTLPDYFLKLYLTKTYYTNLRTNKEFLSIDKYSTIACAVIFDKAGRVVYSTCVDDELPPIDVVSNIRFKNEEQEEILIKNLLETKLAPAIGQGVDFKAMKFKIKDVNNDMLTLKDKNGFLRNGNVLTVYKKISTEQAGKKILIPTWDYRVISKNGDLAECKMSQPYVDGINYPNPKDIVQMTTITRSANKANMFNYDKETNELEGNEVKITNFNDIAFAALASKLKSPIGINTDEYADTIKELNASGFKKTIEIPENNSGLTISTVYKITLEKEKKKGFGTERTYNIIVGVVSRKDGEVVKQEALSQEVILLVPRRHNQNIIEFELLKRIYPLIQQIAEKF